MGDEGEDALGEGEEESLGEYWGERNAADQRHGRGWARLPNGDLYVGQYARGKRHGVGIYVFRGGAQYHGDWRQGLKYGQGVFHYPDGSRYEGDWRYDARHGYGTYYYPNGDEYEGTWYRGLRHGLGTYVFVESGTRFMGTWVKGRMLGPGQLLFPRHRFHGSFKSNTPLGSGAYWFESGCVQLGNYLMARDPELEFGEEEPVRPPPTGEGAEEEEEEWPPRGEVALWRAHSLRPFRPDIMPPEPVSLKITDSRESIPVEVPEEPVEEEPPLEIDDQLFMRSPPPEAIEPEEMVPEEGWPFDEEDALTPVYSGQWNDIQHEFRLSRRAREAALAVESGQEYTEEGMGDEFATT
ncbi:radial spoke head 1 homolog [Schistocerca nitens]|uniref:radial spoke head 1 homolog n=1 Tax=Schistocerca nitens TaxID=7011 RepID=UPI002117EF88|nr:radial spoke head 1 homolog [Schistocerca nitens]